MQTVIPNLYFFEFKFKSSKRVSNIKIDGNLDDWLPFYIVPDLMHLRNSVAFANVYFTWDEENIYIGLNVARKRNPVEVDSNRFWRKDCLELWLDMRNDKTKGVYTEHTHQFFFLPKGRKEDRNLATAGEASQPGSSIQEIIYDHKDIQVASIIKRDGYSLEACISRNAISTYDPINYPFIGFNYHINDTDGRTQWWSCGTDFPRHRDPSTWGTVELIGKTKL